VCLACFIVFGLVRPGLEPTIYRTRFVFAPSSFVGRLILIYVMCVCLCIVMSNTSCPVQSGHQHYLIECKLLSPRYSWQIVHLALINNHPLKNSIEFRTVFTGCNFFPFCFVLKFVIIYMNNIQVQDLNHDTTYQLLLYSENEKGRSEESHREPWFIRTEKGPGKIYVYLSIVKVYCEMLGK
jgi:hypothetical protein